MVAARPIGAHNTLRGADPRAPQDPFKIRRRPIAPEDIAQAIATAALDKKARDLAIFDMRNLVDYTDLFVVCSASNRRQVQAVADEARRVAKQELDLPTVGMEGYEAARWVLVDFGSVVLHVFEEPLRGFYNLDGLWRDAPRLPVPEAEEAGASPWP